MGSVEKRNPLFIKISQPKALVSAKPSQMTWVNATRIRERSRRVTSATELALVFAAVAAATKAIVMEGMDLTSRRLSWHQRDMDRGIANRKYDAATQGAAPLPHRSVT